MQTITKSAARDRSTSHLSLPGNLAARVLTEGHWQMECQQPLFVGDPEKLNWHAERLGLAKPKRIERGLITAKELDAMQTVAAWLLQFAADRAAAARSFLADLDGLLFGGGQRWLAEWQNLIVNEGLDHLLDVTLSGGSQDTSWFVGLLGSSPSPQASWEATDLASVDFVAYDESNLQAWTDGGVSGQSVSNSGSPAAFTISTNSSTIGGAFLIGTNAKATPAGTLYAAGAFTGGDKAADDGDTLSVTSTFTTAAA